MARWYVKEMSNLTSVSVQTLHHYDRIGLLEASARDPNGYRVYSEKDLLKLQQIVALKFFGFDLATIKRLLSQETDPLEHFANQARVLEEKASVLIDGAKVLRTIIEASKVTQSVQWENIIQLIEVYNMSEQLEHSWVKDIFTPEELKEYTAFEKEMKRDATPETKAAFEESWREILSEAQRHQHEDPYSAIGIEVGRKFMERVNSLYGKKYAHLRTKKWEQGFGEGKGLDDIGLTPDLMQWLEGATDAYWHDRLYAILDRVGQDSDKAVLKLWTEAMDDLYGTEEPRKRRIVEMSLEDKKVSAKAKTWLSKLL